MSYLFYPWREEPPERQCGTDFQDHGDRPHITHCDLEVGHKGPHEDGRIEWSGGGFVDGCRLPFYNVRRVGEVAEPLVVFAED
jgi:hypothetical protein